MKHASQWKENNGLKRTWVVHEENADGWYTFSLLGSAPTQRHRLVMHESMAAAWLSPVPA